MSEATFFQKCPKEKRTWKPLIYKPLDIVSSLGPPPENSSSKRFNSCKALGHWEDSSGFAKDDDMDRLQKTGKHLEKKWTQHDTLCRNAIQGSAWHRPQSRYSGLTDDQSTSKLISLRGNWDGSGSHPQCCCSTCFPLASPRVFLLKPAARDPQSWTSWTILLDQTTRFPMFIDFLWCFASSFQQKNLGAFLRVCLKMVFLMVYTIVYPQVRPYFSRENDDKSSKKKWYPPANTCPPHRLKWRSCRWSHPPIAARRDPGLSATDLSVRKIGSLPHRDEEEIRLSTLSHWKHIQWDQKMIQPNGSETTQQKWF